ncbi:hypothetical protein CK203_005466 [Vitis vinifera]|uniref:Uncharacterized protein n=1 Tax=Vitis vinifera TaxID=29760 RepID=A0A438K410_VITVI|nr:hypothetical protein CK203_005466 [Vitis vinifera]
MMQISMERNDRMYTVTVGKQPIVTLWAWWDQEVKEFIRQVRRIHGKRNTQDLIVGLWADHSANYSGGYSYYYDSKRGGGKNRPLEVMALCVGHHCLLIELQGGCSEGKVLRERKVLRDFLFDRHTVVVGVGTERLAKKLEEDYGILIPGGLGELARVVLGEEVNYVRPTKIRWRENQFDWGPFSNDLVKCSTAEAFLLLRWGLSC